jgi:hypothetical protein
VKNVTYRDVIKGRTIKITTEVAAGEHTWQASCETDKEILDTPVRKFTMILPETSDVRVEASGTTRGSMRHSFDFMNSPTQQPVIITKIAPGDYVEIVLNLPPSKLAKDLYIKQLSSKNDDRFVWVQDPKTGANYNLYEGQNVTVNVSSSRVIMSFLGTENNRIKLIVYSTVAGNEQPAAQPQIEPELPPAVEEHKPEATPPKAEPPQPVPKPIVTNSTPATDKPRDATPPPSQSGFKRFLSWLSNIFG